MVGAEHEPRVAGVDEDGHSGSGDGARDGLHDHAEWRDEEPLAGGEDGAGAQRQVVPLRAGGGGYAGELRSDDGVAAADERQRKEGDVDDDSRREGIPHRAHAVEEGRGRTFQLRGRSLLRGVLVWRQPDARGVEGSSDGGDDGVRSSEGALVPSLLEAADVCD